jgi:putative sigma-54 modulation protein
MEVQFTNRSKRIKTTPEIKSFITSEVDKFTRIASNITTCHVILDNEGVEETVEIVLHAVDREISAHAAAKKWSAALDDAIDKVQRQLKKVKEKQQNH